MPFRSDAQAVATVDARHMGAACRVVDAVRHRPGSTLSEVHAGNGAPYVGAMCILVTSAIRQRDRPVGCCRFGGHPVKVEAQTGMAGPRNGLPPGVSGS